MRGQGETIVYRRWHRPVHAVRSYLSSVLADKQVSSLIDCFSIMQIWSPAMFSGSEQ